MRRVKKSILKECDERKYWVLKNEPEDYDFSSLVVDKETTWDGVRNFQANNHMKLMKKGDLCLYYHSVTGKAFQGVAKVAREWQIDPKDKTGRFGTLRIAYEGTLKEQVPLADIKADEQLKNIQFLRQVRLSVSKIDHKDFQHIIDMAGGLMKLN